MEEEMMEKELEKQKMERGEKRKMEPVSKEKSEEERMEKEGARMEEKGGSKETEQIYELLLSQISNLMGNGLPDDVLKSAAEEVLIII